METVRALDIVAAWTLRCYRAMVAKSAGVGTLRCGSLGIKHENVEVMD